MMKSFLLTFFFFYLHSIPALSSAGYDSRTTSSNARDYIRTSCSATLYPDLCYASLSGYAKAIQQDPARLARTAIGVSLSRARHMAAFVSNLSREADYGADPRASSALHDCFSNMGGAVDEIRGSLNQMRKLVAPGSESFRCGRLPDEGGGVREGGEREEVYEQCVGAG
ncbi:endoglucanase 8-like [Hibiscus syriacus]|uniref:Endoglucanase 8-like n=1 Tax=Hibiscus syriacus TaxID=106335 RepID=A0A6A2ZGW3_HIBSY|nr:endoglucanase 8-like [Hibiscus syriacus]